MIQFFTKMVNIAYILVGVLLERVMYSPKQIIAFSFYSVGA